MLCLIPIVGGLLISIDNPAKLAHSVTRPPIIAGILAGPVKPPLFSRLAAVSRALDFGLAAHAHAFAPLGLRQNRVHPSSAFAATAPALRPEAWAHYV